MANHQARLSMYSLASESGGVPRGVGQQASQVSTTTLLNGIHNVYLSSQPYLLDAGTSIVVNTWLTASQVGPNGQTGGTIDPALGARAWEHARRRAEDGCIILGSLHTSTPSLLTPFLGSLPLSIPSSLFTALSAIRPFIQCVTPSNPATPRQVALGVTLTMNLVGNLTAATIALSQGGIDTKNGLLSIPSTPGHRAFDVFYYLLTSASTPAEREFLGLKPASTYSLLARSGTYDPPSYLPTADDAAAADDFRAALKELGIKGSAHRNFISTLAGLLKLGNTLDYGVDEEILDDICDDVGGLLGLDPEVLAAQCSTEDRQTLVGGLYEALVDWVISKANDAIAAQMARIRDGVESVDGRAEPTSTPADDNGDTVCISIIEVPDPALGKAITMRGIFDDSIGINAEMKEDGVDVVPVGSSVLREMQNAVGDVAPDLGIMTGPTGRDRVHELEKREVILEKVALAGEDDGFLKKLLFPVPDAGVNLGRAGRIDLASVLNSSRVWYHLAVHPTDESPASLAALPSITSAWSAGTVSRQLRAWRLPEWANRRNKNLDFTADFDHDEFSTRFAPLGCREGREGIETWVLERGWSNGEVVVGKERIWMRETAWWEAENMLDMKSADGITGSGPFIPTAGPLETGYSNTGSGYFGAPLGDYNSNGSHEQFLHHSGNQSQISLGQQHMAAPSIAPTAMRNVSNGDYGLGNKGDSRRDQIFYTNDGEFINNLEADLAKGKHVETQDATFSRRVWVIFVWALTFWIPSFMLHYIGRMKRPDVRMAWREKFVLVFLIFLINAVVLFWIIPFGGLLCPNYDKAWLSKEVAEHQGEDDFYVSIHGKVYDITKFWRRQHSDTDIETTSSLMIEFAGLNLDEYFVAPLPLSCPGLGIADTTVLMQNNTPTLTEGVHTSGYYQTDSTSKLSSDDWYTQYFEPGIKPYYVGSLVWTASDVVAEGTDDNHMWVTYDGSIYDMTDYFYTLDYYSDISTYEFLDTTMVSAVENNPGGDVTETWNAHLNSVKSNATAYALAANSLNCIKNAFYVGIPDFRFSARCQVNNYILLAFTVMLGAVISIKFLSALQFGSKRRPAPQDKFVICQVPAYTEDEESLRKALDSLTALQYDNKRKLICVICDGVIIGKGNDRPTPKIVLDILGVDPKIDPPALPFKSVGPGNDQLNYGKVYSGLYEFEGNVVPYVVIVKVGKESEQSMSKPGNRGKRDSQILMMSFLNRVHHRAPMNPLELEMFHQINNIIGVDPELYEYMLMIDADTSVREDSLNRLVAACSNNSKIAGICGETGLQNEERSWWSMIQVYEYFISHHLAKAFESLFGSVTCLPGCFSMYRLRTADKGKPLIISDGVIQEYSVCNVDTLHKKNLLSLGEDRYLTTLMTKHFPYMSYKFCPDAYCQTAAPDEFSVLLSQRRRWINSTIHNLVELMMLKDMCGFCCFSMRFVVLIDLTGTIILPATTGYLGYIIYKAATHQGQFPLISIAMLAGVYGLQAIIFILKRQWQHVGWMIIYIIAFPIYSLVLPIYSFWRQDDFSWGNTRIVIGEKGAKQVVAVDGDSFDPRSIPLQRWDDYAALNNLPGRRGNLAEKAEQHPFDDTYELDDMRSVYSSVRQQSVFHGLQGANRAGSTFIPPTSQSPALHGRNSSFAPYSDNPQIHRQSTASFGDVNRMQSPFQDKPSNSNLRSIANNSPSRDVYRQSQATLGYSGGSRAPLGQHAGHQSMVSFDFQRGNGGPDDGMIVEAIQGVLREVDLDTVTKKQVRALVEQRLQTELVGERRTFMDRQIDNELANM
ncbi:class VII chitin synthase [Xylariales sp. PMI_506]|nr:class VII chitin synthase [Xylariales sp. PMI_506]